MSWSPRSDALTASVTTPNRVSEPRSSAGWASAVALTAPASNAAAARILTDFMSLLRFVLRSYLLHWQAPEPCAAITTSECCRTQATILSPLRANPVSIWESGIGRRPDKRREYEFRDRQRPTR